MKFIVLVCCLLFSPCIVSAQWSAIGPNGGGAHLVAMGNGNSGAILAGTRNALLYRSTNQAQTWKPVPFDRSLSATLNTLVTDRCNTDSFFMGTSDSDASKAGIYHVARSGDDWKISPVLLGESVMSLTVSGSNCKLMAAGTVTSVMTSRDAGVIWKKISPSGDFVSQPIVSLAFAPDSNETMYAGTPKLPWKTTDGGESWKPIHVGIIDDSDIFALMVDTDGIFIGACSGIYRSADGGVLWKKSLGIPGVSRRTYTVKTDPSNHQVVYAGTSNGLWKSTNAGASWVQKSTYPVRSIVIEPKNSRRLVLASEVGMWRSEDGADTLIATNTGFVNHIVGAFLDLGGTLLTSAVYEVGAGTLFSTQNSGMDWTSRSGATLFGEHIFHLARISGTVFAAGPQRIFKSVNAGKTWSPLVWTPGSSVKDIKPVPSIQTVLVATASKLYASKDQGLMWRQVVLPPAISRIEKLETSTSGGTWGILSGGNIFLSLDKGVTWKSVAVPDGSGQVNDIALRGDREILAGTLKGLLISDDAGARWTEPSFHFGTVTSVLWHPAQRMLMFSVQNGAPWKSIDGGVTWTLMNPSDFGGEEVSALYWASDFSKLYAVGFTRGVFVGSLN